MESLTWRQLRDSIDKHIPEQKLDDKLIICDNFFDELGGNEIIGGLSQFTPENLFKSPKEFMQDWVELNDEVGGNLEIKENDFFLTSSYKIIQ